MRSLFVDDINGAKSSHRHYDKMLYRQRHQNQVERFGVGGRDYKKVYDWYQPNKRHQEPIERKDFPVKLFNYMHTSNKPFNPEQLSQSMVYYRKQRQQVAGKVTEYSPRLNKSTVLGGTGQLSLSNSVSILQDNPYFPHMYVEKNSGLKNKWTGTRHWDEQERKSITIPRESQTVAKKFKR